MPVILNPDVYITVACPSRVQLIVVLGVGATSELYESVQGSIFNPSGVPEKVAVKLVLAPTSVDLILKL